MPENKHLSIFALSLTLLIWQALSVEQTYAAEPKKSDRTGASGSVTGAKDLFYRQVANQSQALNTGVQYWIELKRNGKISKVSNKVAFKSGDSIRFHVTSNIDAFAYIMLREGSQGERSVLFPDPAYHDNNRLKASVDYSLPQDGFLTFDQNPGTENLILLVSREAIDADKYLNDKTKKHVVIAAARDGSKDLIPGSVVLAYSDADVNSNNLALAPGTVQVANNSKQQQSTSDPSISKTNNTKKTESASTSSEEKLSETNAVTTFVQKDPTQVLAIDLALVHRP